MARSTRSRSEFIARVAMVGVLVAGALGAAPGKPDRADIQAREKFRIAQKAFNLGSFEQALDYYSQAYSLKAHPGFLFNIAQCYRMLREYDRAAFFYKRYLSLATPSRGEEALVTDLIQEVETKQEQLDQEARIKAEAAELRERELARSQIAKAEADAALKPPSHLRRFGAPSVRNGGSGPARGCWPRGWASPCISPPSLGQNLPPSP